MATTARLKFLDEAADVLAFSSPTTAAHLRSTRLESLQEDSAKALVLDNSRVCGGCGDSLVAGWNFFVKTKKRTRQERLHRDTGTKTTTWQCSRCNSFTTLEQPRRTAGRPTPQLLKVQRPVKEKMVVADQAEDQPILRSTAAPPSSTESGVKKRSRNKKSSLQSLLAGRKTAEPKKPLGLMDFMKT